MQRPPEHHERRLVARAAWDSADDKSACGRALSSSAGSFRSVAVFVAEPQLTTVPLMQGASLKLPAYDRR